MSAAVEIPVVANPAKFRAMRESNDLLGNNKALWEQFDRDGYLYLRDVLDREAIEGLRQTYHEVLTKVGLLEEGDRDFRYKGQDFSKFPHVAGTVWTANALHERQPWREFVANAKIGNFFKSILDDDPFWLPIVEYKAVPPTQGEKTRFNMIHQDSFFSKGIPFRICWIPLSHITEAEGGIAVAEGMHTGATVHDESDPPYYFVKPGRIPDSAWVRAEYCPGDLLIMHLSLPHTGVTNESDRYRLSMDIRVMPKSENVPVIGRFRTADRDHILIDEEDGTERSLAFDDGTTFRNIGVGLITRDMASEAYKPGDEMIVAHENGCATIVRKTSSGAYATT